MDLNKLASAYQAPEFDMAGAIARLASLQKDLAKAEKAHSDLKKKIAGIKNEVLAELQARGEKTTSTDLGRVTKTKRSTLKTTNRDALMRWLKETNSFYMLKTDCLLAQQIKDYRDIEGELPDGIDEQEVEYITFTAAKGK